MNDQPDDRFTSEPKPVEHQMEPEEVPNIRIDKEPDIGIVPAILGYVVLNGLCLLAVGWLISAFRK